MLFMFAFFLLIFFGSRGDRGYWRPPWRWMNEQAEHWRAHEGYRSQESALDILNKCYAQGEMDKDEYEDKKATITSMES